MTKITLTNDLKQLALNQYHPFINIDLWSLEQYEYDENWVAPDDDDESNSPDIILQDTVNLKILNKDIEALLAHDDESTDKQSLQEYQKYTSNSDFSNIIFTPFDDEKHLPINDIIISSEYYNGVFYLELPRFYRTISLHLLTNYYDASDDVVLFHTENIIDYVKENPTSWTATGNTERNPEEISTNKQNNNGRYLIPLPQHLKRIPSIEIDVFYQYLSTNGIRPNEIGIIDTSIRGYDDVTKEYEDQKTLINKNDNEYKIVTTTERNPNQTDILQDNFFCYRETSDDFETNSVEINKIYESIIKYSNDNIYIEKYNDRGNNTINRKNELKTNGDYNYIFVEWGESGNESPA